LRGRVYKLAGRRREKTADVEKVVARGRLGFLRQPNLRAGWVRLVEAPFSATENSEERTGDSKGERCNVPPHKTHGFINLHFLCVLCVLSG